MVFYNQFPCYNGGQVGAICAGITLIVLGVICLSRGKPQPFQDEEGADAFGSSSGRAGRASDRYDGDEKSEMANTTSDGDRKLPIDRPLRSQSAPPVKAAATRSFSDGSTVSTSAFVANAADEPLLSSPSLPQPNARQVHRRTLSHAPVEAKII